MHCSWKALSQQKIPRRLYLKVALSCCSGQKIKSSMLRSWIWKTGLQNEWQYDPVLGKKCQACKLNQHIYFCVDNENIQSDLCLEGQEISVKQFAATIWLFPLGLSPLGPEASIPSVLRGRCCCGAQRMKQLPSWSSLLFWVPWQPGAGLSLTPCSKEMRMFNTVNV